MNKSTSRGFTLVELLIVVAIIAILATATFVALDPMKRFQDSRDARRWSDASELMHAIKVNQVDNGGDYIQTIRDMNPGDVYMITEGSVTSGCSDENSHCDAEVTNDSYCVNLNELVAKGYLGKIPVSPNGNGSWSPSLTGYTLTASSSGALVITACESENAANGISITR